MMKKYRVIGLMSGTSLDGLDIAFCEFSEKKGQWKYRIVHATTFNYPTEWKKRLSDAMTADALTLAELDKDLGLLIGEALKIFIKEVNQSPDFIASHGHTVFHNPASFYTTQIGNGECIAARLGIPVINDFRSIDVAKGGQGAPLVPIGDKLLFSGYDFCLNLGGIANISFDNAELRRVAFDIAPCNMALNYLAAKQNLEFDDGGEVAASGEINLELLEKLNGLEYYWQTGNKSLGREWFEKHFLPLLQESVISNRDKMATVTEHIALQIAKVTAKKPRKNMLITGGGAYNTYLVERIRESVSEEVIIPGKQLIDFKEALIFAFLGVLRTREEINILSSVTGAKSDSCAGKIILP